ncbi:MFS transporter [Acetobacter nitrogenifigens]|uniref:MFS transporter n=2 Tax=Acetobacter nitrogenifigens TaxID=285268 RepID=A0A511XEL3_9PROT|nr:MFS transporter [Acetobacter nitrogenifigens DSM 23921 = NBRC 105050]
MSLGPFRSLRSVSYRIWAAGALVSNIGAWVQRTAQDWLVLTQLTHHNASAVGETMALQLGPQLLLLPWTGVAADRFNQRKMLMLTQATMGGLSLALGLLTVTGVVTLWQVYAFAFLFGSVAAFDAPARQVFVAELVDDEDLHNAVALNSTSFNAARMIGPAVSGLVIAWLGTGWAFVGNGLSFIAVLASLAFLRASELRQATRTRIARSGFMEGLRYVGGRPDLKAILIMLALIGTFGLNFPIFISTMAVGVFHVDAGGYGLLSSIMAIGAMAGALLGASRDKPSFTSLLSGSALFGAGCALAAIAPDYWLFAACLVVIGGASLTFTTTTNSLMQLSTTPAMRGRVMALRVGVALGGTPVGAPIIGWLADHCGPRWALGIGALSGFLASIVAMRARTGQPPDPRSGSASERARTDKITIRDER